MVKLAIIEDEPKTRSLLRALIQESFPWVEISGEADSIESAKKLIEETAPQILLLDIQLSDGHAFDLIANIKETKAFIVFVTAYGHHAVKALRAGAIDYIEKPINPEELYSALRRIQELIRNQEKHDLQGVIQGLKQCFYGRIAFPTGAGMKYLETNGITHVKAEGSYSQFFFDDGSSPVFVSRLLRIIEPQLVDLGFVRVHRSYLVNTSKIVEFIRSDGGTLMLADGSAIPFSRKYKDRALSIIGENVVII